ncbi:MAG: T9SS type A sorting domain-containing protein [Calditrichia bacterium]
MRYTFAIITLLVFFFQHYAIAADRKGDIYRFDKPLVRGVIDTMKINNIFLPYQNDGSTAEDAHAFFPNGTTLSFLFQGGIAATGFVNGELRASWMAKASLIQEFQPGKWGMSPEDDKAVFYTVTANDGPGSEAYKNWATAVELGADFQDVDGDDQYDPNIDRPDILGDRTSWTVYNDGTDVSVRSDGLQTPPMGLEIHQQVWAFARADELGNVIFFRYRFINAGEDSIADFIFSIWADPDIGDAVDDLIGSDTTLSLGYIYNSGEDAVYGANPPSFGVDFFQGPVVDSPGDTAFRFLGPWFGVDTLYDKKNLPMTAFTFYNNAGETDPFPSPRQNVNRARDYQEGGFNGHHEPIDPTVFGTGGTAQDNPKFFYSGEPEAGTGWLDGTAADKRFMVNTGPFQLPAWRDENGNGRPEIGEPGVQDIVVAYVVGQGSSPTNSVTELKRVDRIAQLAYDANFFIAGPPPPPEVDVRTFDKKIEFIIDLEANGTFEYEATDKLLNRQVFEGVKIYQMASPSTNEFESGILNRKLIFSFDMDNKYKDIYQTQGFETVQIYAGNNNIKPEAFQDSGSAILRFVVEEDAFAPTPPPVLVNNIEYYFSITAFSINQGGDPPFLDSLGQGAWVGSSGILLENNLGGKQLHRVIPGSDENNPFLTDSADYVGPRTNHDGVILADVVDQAALTGDDYSVSFFDNGNFYRILNESEGGLLVRDSMVFQDRVGGDAWSFPIIDGLSIKVQNVIDGMAAADTIVPEGGVSWIDTSGAFKPAETAVFGHSIDLVKNTFRSNIADGITKDKYIPVEIVLGTTDDAQAQHYRANYNFSVGMKPTFLKAFDITNPDEPRQLYVAYHNPNINGTIDFTANNDIIIFNADYQETERYGRATTDTLFNKEAYMILQLSAIDSIFQANEMSIKIRPFYPNSDVDKYVVSGDNLDPKLTPEQHKSQLDRVKVVPNPYWAYSAYETSYDTPVLKFTHLPNEVNIRIFDLAGQLVKTLRKNDESNELSWNLRNEASLRIASGMYIAHIEAPGIGEKVLKFAVIQREERLDRY